MTNALLFFSKFVNMPTRVHNIWRYEKVVEYMKNQLFGSYSKKMFCQHTRLRYDTFCDLIRVLGPSLQEKITNMR
jgi:hypothetical protein